MSNLGITFYWPQHCCPVISLKKTQLPRSKFPVTPTLPTNSSFGPNLGSAGQFPLALPLLWKMKWSAGKSNSSGRLSSHWVKGISPLGSPGSGSRPSVWQVEGCGYQNQGLTPDPRFWPLLAGLSHGLLSACLRMPRHILSIFLPLLGPSL